RFPLRWNPIVADARRQLDGRAGGRARRRAEREGRRLILEDQLVADLHPAAVVRDLELAIDFPDIEERRARLVRLPVGDDGPHQLLLPVPIFRDVDAKEEVVLSWIEVRRLPAIGRTRFEVVL